MSSKVSIESRQVNQVSQIKLVSHGIVKQSNQLESSQNQAGSNQARSCRVGVNLYQSTQVSQLVSESTPVEVITVKFKFKFKIFIYPRIIK